MLKALRAEEPKFVRVLVNRWRSSGESITVAEVAAAVEAGDLTAARWATLQQELAETVAGPIGDRWAAMADWSRAYWSGVLVSRGKPALAWDRIKARIERWISTSGANLLRQVTAAQQAAVRVIITEFGVRRAAGAAPTARALRGVLGLTDRQAMAAVRYADGLTAAGVTGPKADAAVARYQLRIERHRASVVARTETANAWMAGNDATIREAIIRGDISPATRAVWVTMDDERVCPECGPLHETVTRQVPPLHPQCRCNVLWEEPPSPA